jgi:hypothetical protein
MRVENRLAVTTRGKRELVMTRTFDAPPQFS